MASNDNQNTLQVTIDPVLNPDAVTNVTEELKQRVSSGQAYIDDLRQYYTDRVGDTPVYDVFLAPLEKFSSQLLEIADSLNKGLDINKLGAVQQKITAISSAVGELEFGKAAQTVAASTFDKNTMTALQQFTAELQRIAPSKNVVASIMQSDLGSRMKRAISGGKTPTIDDAQIARRYLKMVMPSIHPQFGFEDKSVQQITNVADYLPIMFQAAQMDTKSLQKSFSDITKEAITANLKEQIAAITAIPEADRTQEQATLLKQLEKQKQYIKKAGHDPILNADFTEEIVHEFENNKRFAKVLIDAGIATKRVGESTYRLPTQITRSMIGSIAAGLQKSYIATTAGYNSPDMDKIVNNPFEYNTDQATLADLSPSMRGRYRMIVARGGYENAQGIVQGMDLVQKIRNNGTSAFILPGENNSWGRKIKVPNVTRDLYRYQKYNVSSEGLSDGGTVLYQGSEAIRFLNRYGGNPIQKTVDTKGNVTPGIVVVDADSFDFDNNEKAREHFGNLAYGMDTKSGHYSFATMHRGDEGQHVTLIRDDVRDKAVTAWRKEQSQNYQSDANTNVLWEQGKAISNGKKLSYEEIQKLKPYDRAAYQIYASTAFASPLTAYSQVGVEDMPDNAKRAKTEDAINKIYSPSTEVTRNIKDATKGALESGLTLHFVRDEDNVSTLNGVGGGLVGNNGAVYLSNDILPQDAQIRGLWGGLKGMGISIQADANGDIHSALKQAGLLDKNGQLMIGGRDVSHGLGIVTESSLKSPDIKEALLLIEQAADENGMVPGADGNLIPYQKMQDYVLTQFALSGEISAIARTIDKKNESGKIGAQFMSHLIPTGRMVQHQTQMWQELDELAKDPDKALTAVFPSEDGDALSRELHQLKKERDEDPGNLLAAQAFANRMASSKVQGRIQGYIDSRKKEMTAGNYFDPEGLDKDSRITQGFLGTSFIQRVLTSARASEENKGLSNLEVVQKTNNQLFKDAMKVADWEGAGLEGLSDEQKQKVAANALLMENMFAGFSEDELKELRDKGLIPANLEDSGFVFDPQSKEFKLGYHRDPSTKKDVMIRYNGAQLLRGLENVKGTSFTDASGRKHNKPYASMFRNTIAVNPKDWEFLASADEDGDAIKRFAGLYYTLLKSDVDANAAMEKAALQYYSDKFADVQVKPIGEETPEDAKANLIARMARSGVARAKMAQFSGQDSRVAQLGLTAEMLADPNNTTALAFYKGMMRSAQLYDYATTYEKKPLEIMMQNEDFKATALGAEYGKGVNAVTEALNQGKEAYEDGKRQLENDENADEFAKIQDYVGDGYYVGKGGVTLDKGLMSRIDQFNLPSAFQANILTSILSRSGTQYNVDEDQTLRDFLINDEEHGLGFENAVGEAEKNFLKAKRGFFVDYYTGKRTGAISDEELAEFHKLQLLAEEERENYIDQHRTGNPDTMKVDGQIVKISKWTKDHNKAIGYTQGRNVDLFGMTNANIAKALAEGMYFEDDARARLMALWTGAADEQKQTLTPVEHLKSKTKSLAKKTTTTRKPKAKEQTPESKTAAAVSQAPSTQPAIVPEEPPRYTYGDNGIGETPNMYTKEDGYMLLKYAQNLEQQGRTDEAETMYQQAEEIIRSTTVSGHTMSTLAGQDQFNSPMMAYGKLYGISSPEDAGVMGQMRKNAGDMMESIVLNHLNSEKGKYHFVDPLDVFGTDYEKKLTGEARVEADKALRRRMAFNYFTPGQKYNGLTINGQANPTIANKENLRGMWDSLMVDENGNVKQVLEMKTMGLHRFQDMMEGRNTDRRYFDEHGVPYAYKIQAAAYANAMGKDEYAVAMTGLTDKDRRELDKAKKNPNYKPQVSPLGKDNFHVEQYKVSDFEIPDTDINGNFIYEQNEQGEKQLKMLRGVAALHALQSRNEMMLSGELAPDGMMNTNNRLLGARQAVITNRLRELGIVNPKDFVSISSPDELAALASSPTSALAISNGDVGALITEILGKVTGMPMALEQRQAVGEIGKTLLSEANNFNANMRKEIFKNNDVSSSQSFMSSTQAQIENATNMLNTLKSDESIKKILSEQPNTQGAELLSNMLKTLETSVGNMVDNRISAAIARGTRDVENAQKSFEETIKGKDGTEGQRKSFEANQRSMQNIDDMIKLIEASAEDDGLTAEQRALRKTGAENLQKQADELRPLYQQANAMLSKTGIDALDEAIGKQIQSPQEAAEKKIQELTKKAYGQGKLLLDTFQQGGLTEDDFKQGISRLFGTGWEGLSDEDRDKLLSGDLNLENMFDGSTGGVLGMIQGRYRDELFGKIRRGREGRIRNSDKALRANEARLMKKTANPEELEKENRYLEREKIRDMLEQYRNTFAESKDPEEQAEYLAYVQELLGDNADEALAERFINGDLSEEELAGLGGQYALIEPYVQQITEANRMKTARSVRQMNRAARRSSLALDRKIATPKELAQEMREDKEWDIRDALQNARDRLSGVDDEALMNLARSYLGDDITSSGLDRFLSGDLSEEELAGLGGQYGSLGNYENAMRAQQSRQNRLREMSMNRRDRSLRRTLEGKGMSPEEQAQIATEDMTQQMRENLEQRMTTFGENSPQFQQAIQRTLGEKATKADAMAFLDGTATPEQMANWGGDYAMLGNYGNYIQDRAMMQREGAENSLDQLMSEKRLMKMQQSPFASTWGTRMMMQGVQQAQKERNLNYRIRQAKQQMRMLDGKSLTGTGSAQPQPKGEAAAERTAEASKPKMSLAEAIGNLPTSADDTYSGAVFYGKDAKSLSENQQAQIALVDGFAQKMGVQVGIHDTLQAPDGSRINGMFNPTSNKIDLALDAEGNLITRTMGHEMMHYIRNNSEEDYKNLMATTKSILQNTPGYDYEGRVQDKLKQYNEGRPEEEWITRDEAEEEVGADAMWDVLSGKDTMNELQKHGSLGNAVAGRLGDYSDTFHEMGTKIDNPEVQAMAAQSAQATEMLRAQFFQASENAARKRQEAMGANQRRRYSMRDTQTAPLAVMRNMSPEQVKETLRRGTMAGASVAVTSPLTGYVNGYGSSTMMFPKEIVDPSLNKDVQLFSGNAWTGVFPQDAVQSYITPEQYKQFREQFSKRMEKAGIVSEMPTAEQFKERNKFNFTDAISGEQFFSAVEYGKAMLNSEKVQDLYRKEKGISGGTIDKSAKVDYWKWIGEQLLPYSTQKISSKKIADNKNRWEVNPDTNLVFGLDDDSISRFYQEINKANKGTTKGALKHFGWLDYIKEYSSLDDVMKDRLLYNPRYGNQARSRYNEGISDIREFLGLRGKMASVAKMESFASNIVNAKEAQIAEQLISSKLVTGFFKKSRAKKKAEDIYWRKELMKKGKTDYIEAKLLNKQSIEGASAFIPEDAIDQEMQDLADARNVKLIPFKDAKDKTQKMNGEAGAKYRFSRRDDEPRKKEKPEWMNDTSNPYAYDDYVYVRRAKRNDNTGLYSTDPKWVHWTKASKKELMDAKHRVAFKMSEDFSRTGHLEETDSASLTAQQEAHARASAARGIARIHAAQNAAKENDTFEDRISKELENAHSDRERKIIAKRAIQELKAGKASYKIDKESGKYLAFNPGKSQDVVDREVKKLKGKQEEERKRDESAVIEAKRNAEQFKNQSARDRVDLEEGKIQDSEYLEKKRDEIYQRKQANEEKLKAAKAEINDRADTKIAQNAAELERMKYDQDTWHEYRLNEKNSAIKQATDKAMTERREKLGSNQKEEAELRAEIQELSNRYGNRQKFNQMMKKTQFTNEKQASDVRRGREIVARLAEIGRENTVLKEEMNPTSEAYGNVVSSLQEVSDANANYERQKNERDTKMQYLQNQARADVENERKLALDQAEAEYKKEALDIEKASIENSKAIDTHTERGKKKKAEELAFFDENTAAKQAELDAKIKEAEENLNTRNAQRELELERLKHQTIYDPANSKNGTYLVDQAYQGKLEEQNRDALIESLKPIAKTGKLPQEETETVTEPANNVAGAAENATNALNALGEAASRAAGKSNEEKEEGSNNADGGNNGGGGDAASGEESAPTPEPTPTPTPSIRDTGAPDDPNFRTTRWGRRVERRRHDDGTHYTDEEETQADRMETRATARAAVQNIGKQAVQTGSRAITNFARSIFTSAVNEAKNFVRQYDALMNEIQTITLKTNDEMSELGKETIQQALELKASVADVATIKADLYRQGLGDDEVNERMEQVVQFSKVTGIKASESVKIVTTAMNTGLADSAQQAMDVLTALGDAAATTADQIQKGIQKAGSSAKVAGVSYEELATLMTIGTSKTQLSGQQIGTALQTIFGRMNKVTQSNYISDLEGGTTSLNDVESALGIVGVKLRDDSGTFRSSYDVLRDLAGQWGSMNDTQKSLVTNAFAGTRQSNIFQTLMEGMSEDDGAVLDEYLELANNSEGTTQTKYEIAMQSLSASMEQVKTAWDAVVQAFVDNGTITGALETITNFLTGIATAAEDGAGKFEVLGSVIVAALAGIATAIAAVTAASATGFAALATFAGPLGWLVGIGLGVGALSLIGSAKGQSYNSKVNNYKERATTRIEQTTKAQTETDEIINELKSLKESYDSSNDKNAFEAEYGDEFNSLLVELNKAIPGVTDEFGNLTLSSENLAAALDKAKEASEQKTEQDIKNMFGQGLSEAYSLMGNYFSNRTSSTLETTYENFGSKESADEVEMDDYKLILGSMFGAGTTAEEGIKTLAKGNYPEFLRMMQAYASERGLTEINPENIWDIAISDIRGQAESGVLDFSNMTYEDVNGNPVNFGSYMKNLIFEYTRDNLVVDQSGNDIIDSALDMFMAYVSSEMLPDGMTTDDVRSLATKMLQSNSRLYTSENGYNPENLDMKTFANLVLETLFTQIMNNGSGGFAQMSQYAADAGEKYAYTIDTSEWEYDDIENVDYGDGRSISNWYKDIEDENGISHRLYFNRNGGKQEVFYKDEDGNIKLLTNTNNEGDLPAWFLNSGLVTVNNELASEASKDSSETYTTLSALGINLRSGYDKNNGYLAMVQKGLNEAGTNASFDSVEAFNNFMDETKVDDTLLSQVIGGAISGDKSGASLAAFQFATTEAGQAWMQEHGDYLTNTLMNASTDNAINAAGLEPLLTYMERDGKNKSFAELETDKNYQDLMQNLKTQLGDDDYARFANHDLDVDQVRQILYGNWLTNKRASYSDEEWDLLTKKAGYDTEIAELNGKTSLTEDEQTHLKELTAQSEEVQRSLNLLFTAEQIRKTRKYGDASEDVASTLENIAKTGADAADTISTLSSKMVELQNKKWAIGKLKTGWNDDAGSVLGLEEADYDFMKKQGLLEDYLENASQQIDDEAATYITNPLIEAVNTGLAAGDITSDWVLSLTSSINDDGILDDSEMASLIADSKDEAVNRFLALAGNGKIAEMKFVITQDENGAVLSIQAEQTGEVTSGKKTSSGGGGGKSAAEELVDKQKKNKTEYEHMVKMVQYQQTKYQNANELGNYGLMIEKEIEVEKKRLPVIEDNIKALKEQIAQTEAESDDWYTLRDAILEAEEEYEEVNNTIEENIKKLEENQQAIYKLRTDLEDTVKEEIENRKSEEEDMLSGSVSMQETILEAIKQRYQSEWDRKVHNP